MTFQTSYKENCEVSFIVTESTVPHFLALHKWVDTRKKSEIRAQGSLRKTSHYRCTLSQIYLAMIIYCWLWHLKKRNINCLKVIFLDNFHLTSTAPISITPNLNLWLVGHFHKFTKDLGKKVHHSIGITLYWL